MTLTVPMRRVFRVVNGGTPTSDTENWDGDVPWATPVDLARVDGGLLTRTDRTLTAQGLRTGSRTVSAGSLIVSTRAPIGYVVQVDRATAFNQGCRGLELRTDGDVRFFRYQLSAAADRLAALGQGSTFVELASEALSTFRVSEPALEEQRAIADYLDRETARIDALIAAKQRMLSLLDEREYSLVSRLTVPDDCSYVHLRYLAGLQSGVTVDGKRDAGADAVTRPYLRVANVQAGHLNLDEVTMITVPAATAVRATLRDGDVVMTEGGDIDKLGRGTVWRNQIEGCLHQNHIFALRPNPRLLDADFLALLSRSAHARTYFESTGVQSTNLASTNSAKILSLPVPALPLETQRNIVGRWRQAANRAGGLIESMRAQITLLKERRQALITAAVTGQVEVPLAA